MSCSTCQTEYMGRTVTDLTREQISDIRTGKKANVAKKFSKCTCKREVYWIFKLYTRIPKGLNYEWDVTDCYE